MAGEAEADDGPGGLEGGLRPVAPPYVAIQVEEPVSLRQEGVAHPAGENHPLVLLVQVLGQDVEEGAVERFVPAPLALQVPKITCAGVIKWLNCKKTFYTQVRTTLQKDPGNRIRKKTSIRTN